MEKLDLIDQANALADNWNQSAAETIRKRVPKARKGLKPTDVVECTDCGEPLQYERAKAGYNRCVDCVEVDERIRGGW